MTAARLSDRSVQLPYGRPDVDLVSDPGLEKAVDTTVRDGPDNAGATAISKDQSLPRNTGKATMSKMAIDMEMRWLNDRLALADRISQILKDGDFDKAATLVREAQRGGLDCMVAWNLLLDYEMQNGRPTLAFRLYNEVRIYGYPDLAHSPLYSHFLLLNIFQKSRLVEAQMSVLSHAC
jgi:hypothetical protein